MSVLVIATKPNTYNASTAKGRDGGTEVSRPPRPPHARAATLSVRASTSRRAITRDCRSAA